jgi:hypothetical protein
MKQRPPEELQTPFDRVTYREGQLLASRDQQDDLHANDRLRRMHTRFLHDTWGIGLGFTVNAETGDDSVHVGPGYAIDISAREILLASDIALPVPATATATDLMLVIGYQPDSAYRDLPDIARLCAGSTLDPRDEKPLFNWRTPDTLNPGTDVPLASVHVQNGALTLPPDLSVRRYASRMIRPHIGFGTLDYVSTGRSPLDVIPVDTSDAGFMNTPEYFVRIDAPGALDIFVQFLANSAYMEAATPKGFLYVVTGLSPAATFAPIQIPIVITWIGVEPVEGCEPVANPILVFTAAGFMMDAAPKFAKATVLKKGVFV